MADTDKDNQAPEASDYVEPPKMERIPDSALDDLDDDELFADSPEPDEDNEVLDEDEDTVVIDTKPQKDLADNEPENTSEADAPVSFLKKHQTAVIAAGASALVLAGVGVFFSMSGQDTAPQQSYEQVQAQIAQAEKMSQPASQAVDAQPSPAPTGTNSKGKLNPAAAMQKRRNRASTLQPQTSSVTNSSEQPSSAAVSTPALPIKLPDAVTKQLVGNASKLATLDSRYTNLETKVATLSSQLQDITEVLTQLGSDLTSFNENRATLNRIALDATEAKRQVSALALQMQSLQSTQAAVRPTEVVTSQPSITTARRRTGNYEIFFVDGNQAWVRDRETKKDSLVLMAGAMSTEFGRTKSITKNHSGRWIVDTDSGLISE